jgi:hypothetical protein
VPDASVKQRILPRYLEQDLQPFSFGVKLARLGQCEPSVRPPTAEIGYAASHSTGAMQRDKEEGAAVRARKNLNSQIKSSKLNEYPSTQSPAAPRRDGDIGATRAVPGDGNKLA